MVYYDRLKHGPMQHKLILTRRANIQEDVNAQAERHSAEVDKFCVENMVHFQNTEMVEGMFMTTILYTELVKKVPPMPEIKR